MPQEAFPAETLPEASSIGVPLSTPLDIPSGELLVAPALHHEDSSGWRRPLSSPLKWGRPILLLILMNDWNGRTQLRVDDPFSSWRRLEAHREKMEHGSSGCDNGEQGFSS